jgi:hypothetical protein
MNIVIVNQGGGKYLFEVPANVKLVKGDTVKCDTRRGVTDGVCYADSIDVSEDVAKLIGNLVGAKFPLKSVVGKVVTSVETFALTEPVCAESAPKQDEPIMLYCVKDVQGLAYALKKGEVYDFSDGGKLSHGGKALAPDGCKFISWEQYREHNTCYAACLIRAEKRAAKVGEWVVIVDEHGSSDTHKGDILKCVERWYLGASFELSVGEITSLYDKRYLVLPDYIPEKVEPTYYSGKVVCVDNGGYSDLYTVGKIYTFTDGQMTNDEGIRSNSDHKCENFAEVETNFSAKFIEYRGEQS